MACGVTTGDCAVGLEMCMFNEFRKMSSPEHSRSSWVQGRFCLVLVQRRQGDVPFSGPSCMRNLVIDSVC